MSLNKQSGIVRIFNLKTDKMYFFASKDIEADIIKARFQLDLAMYPVASLQEEYASLGLELFTIEPYRVLKEGEVLSTILEETKAELLSKGASFYL